MRRWWLGLGIAGFACVPVAQAEDLFEDPLNVTARKENVRPPAETPAPPSSLVPSTPTAATPAPGAQPTPAPNPAPAATPTAPVSEAPAATPSNPAPSAPPAGAAATPSTPSAPEGAAPNFQVLKNEVERLRAEVLEREQKNASKKTAIGKVEELTGNKFGPNVKVTSPKGKVQISGLVQVWYQHVENSNEGIFFRSFNYSVRPGEAVLAAEGNEGNDNDTMRIRRTELRMAVDITENISAYVMIDPAREHTPLFYPIPTFPRHNTLSNVNVADGRISGLTGVVRSQPLPSNSFIPHLLQDAFISVDGVIPHHRLRMGQFKPPSGEESSRKSEALDFVERSMVAGINNVRDIGFCIDGFWFEDRLRYSVGVFNGPAGTVLTDPELTEAGNRSDDNDEKDFAMRIALRPVWNRDKWYGRLEVGYHRTDGVHGEAGQEFNDQDFLSQNALNIKETAINRQGAWISYRPGSITKGWWLRGEYGSGRDRFGFGAYTSAFGTGSIDLDPSGNTSGRGGNVFTQRRPAPVKVEGWYFSTGYRIADSVFAEQLKNCGGVFGKAALNTEFAFRYETYENVSTEDLVDPDRKTDQFKTEVLTFGLNYYIKEDFAKIQANYLIVKDPEANNPQRLIQSIDNNVFVVNFQIAF